MGKVKTNTRHTGRGRPRTALTAVAAAAAAQVMVAEMVAAVMVVAVVAVAVVAEGGPAGHVVQCSAH